MKLPFGGRDIARLGSKIDMPSDHIPFIARFTSVWAQRDKTGRLKGQRMSDINNKIGKAIISRPETLLIINKNITVDLKPFFQYSVNISNSFSNRERAYIFI